MRPPGEQKTRAFSPACGAHRSKSPAFSEGMLFSASQRDDVSGVWREERRRCHRVSRLAARALLDGSCPWSPVRFAHSRPISPIPPNVAFTRSGIGGGSRPHARTSSGQFPAAVPFGFGVARSAGTLLFAHHPRYMPSQTAVWNTLVITCFLLVLLHLATVTLNDDRLVSHPAGISPAFKGHWLATMHRGEDPELQYRRGIRNTLYPSSDQGSMGQFSTSNVPLQMVPRTPLITNMRRHKSLPLPSAAMYIDRPPPDPERPEVVVPVTCSSTRQPQLRTLVVTQWTIEVTTSFLNNEHFGKAWQTVVGRTGATFSTHAFDSKLSALALKLDPDMHLLLQAWLTQQSADRVAASPHYVSVRSKSAVEATTWYHIVGRSDGQRIQLFVNGELAGESEPVAGALSIPPSLKHGDLTLGCGMHDSLITDACSCLIAEARVLPEALAQKDWLWLQSDAPSSNPCAGGARLFAGVCVKESGVISSPHGRGSRLRGAPGG